MRSMDTRCSAQLMRTRAAREEIAILRGERPERTLRAGRDGQQERALRRCDVRVRRLRGRLLQNDVHVPSSKREPGDARDPPSFLLGPRAERGAEVQAERVEVDLGVHVLQVEASRNLPVLESQRGLDEPCDSGGRVQVPKVRFHGTDDAAPGPARARTHDGRHGFRLQGIALARSGAVQFHVVDLRGVDAGSPVRLAVDLLLGAAARSHDPVGLAAVHGGRAANDGVDPVPVGEGDGQRLQEDDSRALTADEAVRARVERLAMPLGGEDPRLRHGDDAVRGDDQVHAARDRHRRLTRPDALAGEVNGDERGGAGDVKRDARPLQVEEEGDAVRREGERIPRRAVTVDPLEVQRLELAVIVPHDADEDGGTGARELLERHPGVLERLPRDLEEQSVLRIHVLRLAWRDAKRAPVEAFDVVEEAARPGHHLASAGRVRVEEGVRIPAAPGDRPDGVLAVTERLPVAGGPAGRRESASDSDDGYWFSLGAGITPHRGVSRNRCMSSVNEWIV